jgi:tight adherence protein C
MMRQEILLGCIVFVAVVATGAAFFMLRKFKRSGVQARLEKTGANPASRDKQTPNAGAQKISGVMSKVGTAVSSGPASATLREQLVQAGYDGPNVPSVYMGTKLVLAVVGVLVATALIAPSDMSTHGKLIAGGGIVVGMFMLPNFIIGQKRSKRRNHFRSFLPHAIDLLEVCASSGMGMDMAWNSVGEEMRQVSPSLADEMVLAHLEIRLGAARADAMRHMARRTGADELHSLAAVLVQSERFGTSMSEALTLFAQSMREARSHRAQEAAEKMSVKLMLPMLMFIFPALVLVTAGPAFILLYRALSH